VPKWPVNERERERERGLDGKETRERVKAASLLPLQLEISRY
jgi:hypothetical protein